VSQPAPIGSGQPFAEARRRLLQAQPRAVCAREAFAGPRRLLPVLRDEPRRRIGDGQRRGNREGHDRCSDPDDASNFQVPFEHLFPPSVSVAPGATSRRDHQQCR
jgi:hypothetical protein